MANMFDKFESGGSSTQTENMFDKFEVPEVKPVQNYSVMPKNNLSNVLTKTPEQINAGAVVPLKKIDSNPVFDFFDKTLQAVNIGLSKSLERLSGGTKINENPFLGPASKPLNDIVSKSYGSFIDSAPETLLDTTKKIQSFSDIMQSGLNTEKYSNASVPATDAEKIGKGIDVVVGGANAAFIPVISIFEAAKQVPGVDIPVKGMEWLFGKTAEVGSFVGNKALDALPISEQDKESLRQPISDLTGLISMIVLGGTLFKGAEKGLDISKAKINEYKFSTSDYYASVRRLLGEQKTETLMDDAITSLKEKVTETKNQGIEITPEVAKKITDEVSQEVLLKKEAVIAKEKGGEIEDWENNYAQKYGEIDAKISELQKEIKSSAKKDVIELQKKLDSLIKKQSKIESEWVNKWNTETKNPAKAESSNIDYLLSESISPSKSIVAPNLPKSGLETKVSPSLIKTLEPAGADKSIKYVSPSHLYDLADKLSIYTDYNKTSKISQVNEKSFTNHIEEATGVKADVRIKSEKSFNGKVERYKLRGKDASTIADTLAGRIVVKESSIPAQIENIRNNFKVEDVWNAFENPTEFGYRGVNIRVRLTDGVLAEIQIHTPESISIAGKIHKLYERWRNVDLEKLSVEQIAEMEKDIAESKKIASEFFKEVEQPKLPTGLPTIKPITVKPETKISELKLQINELGEVLDSNPLKSLSKYESKRYPGELPEVTGERDGNLFKQKGDQIAQSIAEEMGHPEWGVEDVSKEYSKYAETRDQLKELKAELRETKSQSFTDYTSEQIDKINTLLQSVSEGTNSIKAGFEPITGTGELKTRGLAKGVEEKAVKNKLTKVFGDLPEYRSIDMADQAKRSIDLVEADYELGKRIAMGLEPAPKGLIPESVFTAVENRAIRENDIATIRDLATNSMLSVEATTMGQRLRALAERDPEAAISKIKEVAKERSKAAEKKLDGKSSDAVKAEIKKSLKEKVAKSKPSKYSWDTFLKEIAC